MPRRKDYIHKRLDGRWEGRYNKGRNADGKIIYGSVYGKTFQEVKEKRLKKIKELDNQKQNFKSCLFETVLDNWLIQKSIYVKKSTLYKYQNLIEKQIKPILGKRNIVDITSNELNSFIIQKIKSGKLNDKGGLSSSYVKTIAIVLNSVMKYAIQENIIENKIYSIPKPVINKKELQILNKNEKKLIESYIIKNLTESNLAILLSLNTGLRIGEVCALRWKDIDLQNQIIKVRHSIVRVSSSEGSYLLLDKPKTVSSTREIPIINSIYQILKAFQKEDEMFFATGTKEFLKPRTLEYRFKQILKICNVKHVNFHALRHTFATTCIQAGVDVKSLSEILGHSNASITLNTYVHSSIEIKKEQLEKIDHD